MAPWQQAKVFGLKEAWKQLHGEKTYGQASWIAERVYVQGHPKKHPSREAISQLLNKMEEDEEWFPGKVYGSLGGRLSEWRAPTFTKFKRDLFFALRVTLRELHDW